MILFSDSVPNLSSFCKLSGVSLAVMAMKLRQSQRSQAKKWSTLMLVLLMLFMLTIVLLMLLSFGVFSLPIDTFDEYSPTDLSSFRRAATERWHESCPVQILVLFIYLIVCNVLIQIFFFIISEARE